jgi:hypothetical protein
LRPEPLPADADEGDDVGEDQIQLPMRAEANG